MLSDLCMFPFLICIFLFWLTCNIPLLIIFYRFTSLCLICILLFFNWQLAVVFLRSLCVLFPYLILFTRSYELGSVTLIIKRTYRHRGMLITFPSPTAWITWASLLTQVADLRGCPVSQSTMLFFLKNTHCSSAGSPNFHCDLFL